MIIWIVEQQRLLWGRVEGRMLLQQFHETGADGHGNAHDDALAHTANHVLLAVVRRVEKVVGRFLERGQHQNALLHLCQTVAGYSEDFSSGKGDVRLPLDYKELTLFIY